jgi:monoamine oxidase
MDTASATLNRLKERNDKCTERKQVLILGGGFGGLYTALGLEA